jgi:RNA polymerase sigma-70 factor (ECF subfamily)
VEIKFKEDYGLVNKYLNGDVQSGKILYANVFQFLRKSIFKDTKSDFFTDEDREDILQTTLERSIQKLYSYNGTSKFSTWIISISKYVIKEKIKEISKIREREVDNDINIVDIIDVYNQDPLKIILTKEKITSYQLAFNQLPDDYKYIIMLRNYNGMSRSDVSKLMDRSVDAVDKLYFRAIKKLKENLLKIL